MMKMIFIKTIKNISFETGYSTIVKIYNDAVYDSDNIAILININGKLQTKINMLKNKVGQLWKSFIAKYEPRNTIQSN